VGDVRQQCEATTKRGTRCKRLAKAGSRFCGLHDGRGAQPGAPKGNRNARKHGFYAGHLTTEELEDLAVVAAAAAGLEDEIGLLRVRIRRALAEGCGLDQVSRALGRLTQMLKAQRQISGEAADSFQQALAEVLDGLEEELDLGLG
jgi:hypothetical protein